MKPFFEDAGEVEHVIGLTRNPGFNATLADMLREHAIATGVPAHWLDDAAQLPAPPYEPGCDEAGMPLDPGHPWNGGPGYGVNLNSRQWAIVEALAAAENGSDISAPLLALHAVEVESDNFGKARKLGAIKAGSAKGGRQPKRKEWAELAARKYAKLPFKKAWERLPEWAHDTPNFGQWIVYRDGEKLCAKHDQTGIEDRPITRDTWRTRYYQPARKRAER